MNAFLEFAPVWLVWTGAWWGLLAAGVALWFWAKPPRTAAVRHAALAAALMAGTLAGLIPRWGTGVVSLRQTEAVPSTNFMSAPMVEEPTAAETLE
jgi:hypothetical protein